MDIYKIHIIGNDLFTSPSAQRRYRTIPVSAGVGWEREIHLRIGFICVMFPLSTMYLPHDETQ